MNKLLLMSIAASVSSGKTQDGKQHAFSVGGGGGGGGGGGAESLLPPPP